MLRMKDVMQRFCIVMDKVDRIFACMLNTHIVFYVPLDGQPRCIHFDRRTEDVDPIETPLVDV